MKVFTPEQVEVPLETAGFGSRSLAYLLDFVFRWIFVVFVFLCALFLYLFLEDLAVLPPIPFGAAWSKVHETLGVDSQLSIALGLAATFIFIVEWSWPIYFEVLRQGQSPGKKIFALRVVDLQGLPIGFRSSALRTIFLIVDLLPSFGFVSMLSMMFSPRNQRLGDMVARTVVIYDEGKSIFKKKNPRAKSEEQSASAGEGHEVLVIAVDEFGLLESFFERRDSFNPESRALICANLVKLLAPKLSLQAPQTGSEAEVWLEKLYQQAQPEKREFINS